MKAKLGILGLLLAGLIVFVLQNLDPVPLVLLNIAIPLQLPVSIWMLIFVGAGVLTSLCLQLLQLGFFGKPSTKIPRKEKPSPPPSEPSKPKKKFWEQMDREREEQKYTATAAESDWETPSDDDWNIEEPPKQTSRSEEFHRSLDEEPPSKTSVREEFNRSLDEEPPVREEFNRSLDEEPPKTPPRTEFNRSLREEETKQQQPPQQRSRSSSVYSYGYEKPKDTAVGKIEKIYDVPYRVIIPPYKNRELQQMDDEDDEEWIE